MSEKDQIEALLLRLKDKSEDCFSHSLRVYEMAQSLVAMFDLSEDDQLTIVTASVLHDIGVLGISDSLVTKDSRLNVDEYEEIQRHVELADEYIRDLGSYADILPIIRHHHENYNGFGYPDGLEGEAIPFGARILHVIEAYDSMVNARPFQGRQFSSDQALAELTEYSGRIYDPKVVEVFTAMIRSDA